MSKLILLERSSDKSSKMTWLKCQRRRISGVFERRAGSAAIKASARESVRLMSLQDSRRAFSSSSQNESGRYGGAG